MSERKIERVPACVVLRYIEKNGVCLPGVRELRLVREGFPPDLEPVEDAKPKIDVVPSRYIVERDEQFDGADHCMVMLATGEVLHFGAPAFVLAWINKRERRLAKGAVVRVAQIEWRDGLKPPKEG